MKALKKNNDVMYWLKFLYLHDKKYLFLILLANSIEGILQAIIDIFLIMRIFMLLENNIAFIDIIYLLLGALLIFLIKQIIHSLYWQCYDPIHRNKVRQTIQSEIIVKAVNVDLECYDNTQYYTDFVVALEKSDECLNDFINIMGIYAKRFAGIITILALISKVNLEIFLPIILTTLLGTKIKIILNNHYYERYMAMSKMVRRNSYIMTRFAFWEYSQELRLHNFPGILINQFNATYNEMNNKIDFFAKKIISNSVLVSVIENVLLDFIILSILCYQLFIDNNINLAEFATMFNASTLLRQCFNELTSNYTKLSEDSLFTKKIVAFLNYNNKIKCGVNNVKDSVTSIIIDNISFSYPFSERKIIKNLSMKIDAGKKIAIVGLNGSGKSTLTKLLLHLYDVDEGNIYYGEHDIKEYNLDKYREQFGVVFQDFNLYSTTLYENIFMDAVSNNSKERAKLIFDKFNLKNWGVSLDTKISSEFDDDGINLSGGQAQKLSIARIYTKNFNTIILDEPSSALDPYTEVELNNMIINELPNVTVIFISHRLTTTTIADKIFFMEEGTIIEEGNHSQLMKLNGKYAELFKIQASKYT